MAEGGNQPSLQDGSDADIAFVCTPCSEEGSREEAVKYCPECDEYLCSTCSRCHLKMKATRDHKLAEKEKGKHESKITKSTAKIKCRQHPDRDIEMYCGTHDMVYCLMCIATEHRSCGAVTSLTDAAGSNFKQKEADRLQEEYESIKEVLTISEKKKRENLVSLEEKRNTTERRLQEIEEALVEHIKMLSQQDKTNLNETYCKVKEELESDIKKLNSRISEMERVRDQFQATTEVNQENQFVHFKLYQQIMDGAKNLHAQFESNGKVLIDFAENTSVTRQLMEVKSLGKINEARMNKKREIKRQKEINARMQNDNKTTCHIIDMCQLDSGVCILADLNNANVKLIDTIQNVKSHFDLGVYPTGICKTGHNEIAVKLGNNKIDVLSVGTCISKVRSISVKKGGGNYGIAYTDGKFWASAVTEIGVYDTNGTFERTVTLAKCAIRQTAVYQNSVYTADRNDGIVLLWSDGTTKTRFQDSKLTSTVGVCISNDGTVYALDEKSKAIVMFSQYGKCLGQLVPEIPSGKCPESLCYDGENDCILIGYLSSDTVTVLHLSD